jgi:hypothetical protein
VGCSLVSEILFLSSNEGGISHFSLHYFTFQTFLLITEFAPRIVAEILFLWKKIAADSLVSLAIRVNENLLFQSNERRPNECISQGLKLEYF